MADEKRVEFFADVAAFEAWLSKNHADHPGIWLKIAKKGAPTSSVSYDEALDVAISFGWIDGQKKPLDEQYWLQAFTARRPRSVWSKRNADMATAMLESGAMHPSGAREIEAAKTDGRWDRAYAGQSSATELPEFLEALAANPAAEQFYRTISAANRFALYYRLNSVKREETRTRKIAEFVAMLERGETFH